MPRILEGPARGAVERLVSDGEAHVLSGEHAEALACFVDAWEQLPEPREAYPACGDIFRGMGRVLRARGQLSSGLDLLLAARPGFAPILAAMGWRASGE